MARTMGQIADRYDETRNQILDRIAQGKISASMSNIEYYDKPWSELDVTNPGDRYTIFVAMGWDEEAQRADLRITAREA